MTWGPTEFYPDDRILYGHGFHMILDRILLKAMIL